MTADLNFTVICSSEVYVIAHVPIGYLPYAINTTAIRESYNEQLVKIFRNYSDVVQGQFYGHTHRDSIMVLLDHQGTLIFLRNDFQFINYFVFLLQFYVKNVFNLCIYILIKT